MEMTQENYPEAFCEVCNEMLPEPQREDLGEKIYKLYTMCGNCGTEYWG